MRWFKRCGNRRGQQGESQDPAGRSISRREVVDLDPLLSAPCDLTANLAHSPSAGSMSAPERCGRSREIAVGDGGYVWARRARSREIEG